MVIKPTNPSVQTVSWLWVVTNCVCCAAAVGSIALKLNELPNCPPPLEQILSFLFKEGLSGSLHINLVVGALEELLKGVSESECLYVRERE